MNCILKERKNAALFKIISLQNSLLSDFFCSRDVNKIVNYLLIKKFFYF